MLANLSEPGANLFGDRLDLFRICPAADYKEVGERRDVSKIQDSNVDCFFRFGGADCNKPGRGREWCADGMYGGVALLSDGLVLS